MLASSVNAKTFTPSKEGSSTKIAATVDYSTATDTATPDPTDPLWRGGTHKAVVSTGAKDVAGNPLDQNSSTTGLQQKAWSFTVS